MKRVELLLLVVMCFSVGVISAAECKRREVLQLKNGASSSEKGPLSKLQRPGETAFFFRSGRSIDADGAPKAYHDEILHRHDLFMPSLPGMIARWKKGSAGPDTSGEYNCESP